MGAKKSDLEDSNTLAEWNVILKDFLSQGPAVAGLIENLSNNTFVHAYLISGPAGIGKRTLRDLMTKLLLCTSELQRPCGQCPSCVQCESNTHPDVITLRVGQPVSPDVKKGMNVIPIGDIRYAIAKAGEHTFTGGRRVIRIEDAERMNESAANALLKTL